MTAFTFGEATTRALAQAAATRSGTSVRVGHRTGARVRRDSIEAGTFEDMFFATPAKGECDRLIRMARTALDAGRRIKREARGQGRAGRRTPYNARPHPRPGCRPAPPCRPHSTSPP